VAEMNWGCNMRQPCCKHETAELSIISRIVEKRLAFGADLLGSSHPSSAGRGPANDSPPVWPAAEAAIPHVEPFFNLASRDERTKQHDCYALQLAYA